MADTVLFNGNVRTLGTPARATAVVVRDGLIAAVGSDSILSGAAAGARRINLNGRTVIPGFHDAHAHVWKMGQLRTTMLDVRSAVSLDALVSGISAFRERLPPGAWVLARGYNEAALLEGRAPTRLDLDRASPDRPVVVTRTCGHVYAANSLALERAGIRPDTPAPTGGVIERDADGNATGLLYDTAMGLMNRAIPPVAAGDYERMIVAALQHQLSLGITSSSDCGVRPEVLEVYRRLERERALPTRMNVMPLRRADGVDRPIPLPEAFESDMLRVDTVKFLADGGLSGATAALSVNYRHANHQGLLRFDREELFELCRESHAAGWRIATHAIGDVAIDQILDIYETLGDHPKGWDHRIEHFGLPDAGQLARASRLRVVAVPQTIFIRSLGRNFRNYLPDSFIPRTYPVRAMLDAGVRIALSSDAPVVEDDNPISGMIAAVTRRDLDGHVIASGQAITAAEALHAYTVGGAVATAQASRLGSIEPGKWADLAVLSGDPVVENVESLAGIEAEMTMLAGKIVFEHA